MALIWTTEIPLAQWDKFAAELNAHPLQSALWGEARKKIDALESLYLASIIEGKPQVLARVETRDIKGLGKIAWIAKGPVFAQPGKHEHYLELQNHLKQLGFQVIVSHEYIATNEKNKNPIKTIWIDLNEGKETLFANLDKQWRYGVNRAKREGVEIIISTQTEIVETFYTLCEELSQQKSFDLPGSLPLINFLLNNTFDKNVSFSLFSAIYQEKVIGGAVIARVGNNAFYFWGASDRNYPKQRAGEAIQWAVIEWAIENKLQRYDLEGIDPINNPGVYAFKKKMGGYEIILPNPHYQALSFSGLLAIQLAKLLKKI